MTCRPGMCNRDPACADVSCPGRGFPDEPLDTPESDGLLAVVLTVFLVFVTVVATAAVFLYAYRNFYPA